MIVPKLRFGDFEESWEQYKFSDAVSITDCKHRTPEYINTGIPVVSPGLIRWGALNLSESSKKVSEEEAVSLMDHCIVKQNDLIFSRNQSVGIASQVKTDERFVLGQDVVLLQENKLSIDYVYFCIQTPKVQNLIKRASGGSTFSRINLGELKKLNLYCGKSDEQQKIASFLSKVDKKIGLLTEKKVKLNEYKKGVMQQLFNGNFEQNSQDSLGGKVTFTPPTLRFKADDGSDFPDWEEKTLGDYYKKLSTGMTPSRRIPKYYTGENLWITSGELNYGLVNDTKERITSDAISDTNLNIYPTGTFFIAITGLEAPGTRGRCAINATPATTNQSCMAFEKIEDIQTLYLFYWYTYFNEAIYCKYAQGTKQQSFNNYLIKLIPIILPIKSEQTKIANFLSAIDQKIDLVNSELEKAKQWQKGLLQQMFV